MLLNRQSLSIATKLLVFFLSPKLQTAPLNIFLNVVRVQFSDQVKYLGAPLSTSLNGDNDTLRQVKSLYCAINELKGTLDQCSPEAKTLYSVLIACQCMLANCGAHTHRLVWNVYELPITMPYRTMHYIPRNVSVRPHQANHCIRCLVWKQSVWFCSTITNQINPLGTSQWID